MNCENLPGIPNPIAISQKIYGVDSYNDVRDSVVNSVRRFYQILNNYYPYNQVNSYLLLQEYMVKILMDSGRNPKAVNLPLPPIRLQKNIFPFYYLQSNFNKDIAFENSIKEAYLFENGEREAQILNIIIDYNSV